MPLTLGRGNSAHWLEGSLDEICALSQPCVANEMRVQAAAPCSRHGRNAEVGP